MTDPDTPIWYASYGSNLLRQRFLAYLEGGEVPRSTTGEAQSGARDTERPSADQPFVLPHHLLFAHAAPRWGGGGVAKITATPDAAATTQSRAWRITLGQLEDVFAQENRRETTAIDLDRLVDDGRIQVFDSWYGTLLCAGAIAGEPVLTFTGPTPDTTLAPAHGSYLRVVGDGLRELRDWSTEQVATYLADCPGNRGQLTPKSVARILEAS